MLGIQLKMSILIGAAALSYLLFGVVNMAAFGTAVFVALCCAALVLAAVSMAYGLYRLVDVLECRIKLSRNVVR